jgi:hypothetical protein
VDEAVDWFTASELTLTLASAIAGTAPPAKAQIKIASPRVPARPICSP